MADRVSQVRRVSRVSQVSSDSLGFSRILWHYLGSGLARAKLNFVSKASQNYLTCLSVLPTGQKVGSGPTTSKAHSDQGEAEDGQTAAPLCLLLLLLLIEVSFDNIL